MITLYSSRLFYFCQYLQVENISRISIFIVDSKVSITFSIKIPKNVDTAKKHAIISFVDDNRNHYYLVKANHSVED